MSGWLRISCALGVFTLLACAEDEPTGSRGLAVWSDDDVEIAVGFIGYTNSDGFHHEVWLYDGAGGEGRRLTASRPGAIAELYFMRAAGYVLLGGHTVRERSDFVDRIELDGTVTRILESEEYLGRVTPSPEGSFLARTVHEDDCQDRTRWGTGSCSVSVALLDPWVPEAPQPVGTLDFPAADGGMPLPPVDRVFSPSGTLHVSDGHTSYEVRPDGEALAGVAPPRCFAPRTTSSDISAEGRSVLWDPDRWRLVITQPEAPGYPARCFPE